MNLRARLRDARRIRNCCALLALVGISMAAGTARADSRSILESLVPDWKSTVIGLPAAESSAGARNQPQQGAAAPVVSGMEAAIDGGFLRWSQGWAMDRYVPGSIQVGSKECDAASCRVFGTFRFVRMGTPLTIEFGALLRRAGTTDYAVAQLCYSDGTTGMRDCR